MDHKRSLEELTGAVMDYLTDLDDLMKESPSEERDKKLAKLQNSLEYSNDRARFFGLNIDYKNDGKRKERRAAKRRKEEQ